MNKKFGEKMNNSVFFLLFINNYELTRVIFEKLNENVKPA